MQAVQSATAQLRISTENPKLEAELLLMSVLRQPRSYLHAWPENILDEAELNSYEQLIQRRLRGEPIAHLTGEKEFWSLPLKITADVLIPRPDTELLVEVALQQIPEHRACKIADLGTGSGAIAIALASERPYSRIMATDISAKALDIAKENAQTLGLANIRFFISEWCNQLNDHEFDIIASNPPYIAEGDPHLDQGDLPHEPASSLSSGPDGLNDIRVIVDQARAYLKPAGKLILEHGYNQQESVALLLSSAGYSGIECHQDLAGNPRVTIAAFLRG